MEHLFLGSLLEILSDELPCPPILMGFLFVKILLLNCNALSQIPWSIDIPA